MYPLAVLLLSDGRPGHYHLAEGVAAAIGRVRPIEVTTLGIRRRKWVPGRALAELHTRGTAPAAVLMAGYGVATRKLPRAGLVVSAGGETLVANAAVARGLAIPNIFCGTLRRLPPDDFSLVVSSYASHAGLDHHVVALKPSGIDPDSFDRAAGAKRSGPELPPKLAGLLIGGNSGYFRYGPRDWRRLISFLEQSHTAFGTRWIASTSRRSPSDIADTLAAMAARPDNAIAAFTDFRKAGPGTLPRIFASVGAIVCTEDSSTMISEAVCAQLPVIGVAPEQHGFSEDERQYRAFMAERDWCRFVPLADLTPQRFLTELAAITPLTENHLDTLAKTLKQRLPQLFV